MNDEETPHSIERPRKITVRPEDGVMWVAVGPDGSVMPIPQQSTGFPDDPMAGITRAVHTSYSPEWRVETAPLQRVEGLPPGKRVMWRDGLVVEDDLAELARHRARIARSELERTDYIITKSVEESRAVSAAWKTWRSILRDIVNGSGEPVPDMPAPWA